MQQLAEASETETEMEWLCECNKEIKKSVLTFETDD